MEETISIKRENVLNAYKQASEEQKTLLEKSVRHGYVQAERYNGASQDV